MSYSLRHRNVEIVETKKRSYKKKNLKPLNETVIINSNSTMLDIDTMTENDLNISIINQDEIFQNIMEDDKKHNHDERDSDNNTLEIEDDASNDTNNDGEYFDEKDYEEEHLHRYSSRQLLKVVESYCAMGIRMLEIEVILI